MDGARHDSVELIAEIRLALIPGVGPRLRHTLLEAFGSAQAVLNAAPNQLRSIAGIGTTLVSRIVSANTDIDAEAEFDLCRRNKIGILPRCCAGYPKLLTEIHDPPGVLFHQGELRPEDQMAVAIVGTRHASRYGTEQARRLAASLARAGLTIVSGLARGVDAAAHRGALEAGGRTLAVLAGGVLNIYPPEHRELADLIRGQGALISENAPRSEPVNGSFPQRNRIITGLSLGVIVVEAAVRSGAMISARHAIEQNREVFAVPGRVDNRGSRGCHQLIRDGAKLVESADDVLEEFGPLVQPVQRSDGQVVHRPAELKLNDLEKLVLSAIELEDTSIDRVVSASGVPIHRVLATISVLETRRLVRRVSGNVVVRA